MRITPRDLLALGAADALVVDTADVAAHLAELSAFARHVPARRAARRAGPRPSPDVL